MPSTDRRAARPGKAARALAGAYLAFDWAVRAMILGAIGAAVVAVPVVMLWQIGVWESLKIVGTLLLGLILLAVALIGTAALTAEAEMIDEWARATWRDRS